MTWKDDFDDDSLLIRDTEIEELDNDELNANEAGFLKGYHELDEY